VKEGADEQKQWAARALGGIGPPARDAIPLLVTLLEHKEPIVQDAAAKALGDIGPAAAAAVPDLIRTLRTIRVCDWTDSYRDQALVRLGELAVPALIEALRDETRREIAGLILCQIGRPAMPAIVRSLKDADPEVREEAAKTLRVIAVWHRRAPDDVPLLVDALRDDSAFVRMQCSEGLGELGKAARPAIPALIEAIRDDDSGVRGRAFSALGKILQDDSRLIPLTVDALRDRTPWIRESAARRLGYFGPEARSAAPALVKLLEHESIPGVRAAASEALKQIQDNVPR
jgi:HEAT repeat protein